MATANIDPVLTIGFPVYNRRAFLAPALQSIFAQTFKDWELIIVDDTSEDGSAEFVSLLRDGRIRLLNTGFKRGLAARLNQIIQAARGKYIARMDADDLLDRSRFEKQVNYLRTHPEIDVVGCSLVVLDHEGRPKGIRCFPTDHANICSAPVKGIQLSDATVVAKTEWFRQHLYNEDNLSCEDWELWFSNHQSCKLANLREPLYYYREFTTFSITKYIDAKCRMVRLMWRERANLGLLQTVITCLRHYALSFLNLLAYSASIGGLHHPLIRRRSDSIDEGTREQVLLTIQNILHTSLPLVGSPSADSSQLCSSAKSPYC